MNKNKHELDRREFLKKSIPICGLSCLWLSYENTLTHEIVQDTEKVFELKVTECIWATVFREAGLGGEIGHATICNMDYSWTKAFNPDFKMERSKTLMQGDDCCNHKYIDTA